MKKIEIIMERVLASFQEKTIRVIKLTLFLLLMSIFQLSANGSYNDGQIILTPNEESGVLSLFPQQRITGKVTDKSGTPFPGVNVVVTGTSQGTTTDIAGKYSIDVPQGGRSLTFSFIGMKPQEITIGTLTQINITMSELEISLDEVVVIGYGTQMKESLTGSVSTIQADVLTKGVAPNVIQRMQGRVPGMTILNSHRPGGEATVLIRGVGTINNSDPLFIIDNVPVTTGLSDINPEDIESMSVLKDAASTAIYGTRGANGVIIIKTKSGKSGTQKITFSASTGFNSKSLENKPHLLNTQEYGEMLWLEAKNRGIIPGNNIYGFGETPVIPDYYWPVTAFAGDPRVDPALYNYPNYLIMPANKTGTDWFDESTRNGNVGKYDLSVSNGTKSSSFAFSAGYQKEESIFLYNGFERYSARINSDAKLKDWIAVGENVGITYSNTQGDQHLESGGIVTQILSSQPIVPVYDIMGNFAGGKAPNVEANSPVAALFRGRNNYTKNLRVIGDVFAQADITKALHFKTLVGIDFLQSNIRMIGVSNPEAAIVIVNNTLDMYYKDVLQWNWTNTLIYDKLVGKHYINALIGTETVSNTLNSMTASRTKYFIESTDYMVLSSGMGDQKNGGGSSQWKTLSYFGRLNYNFDGKYLLQFTMRRDGSSRFGKNSRWGNFPALSAGWNISKENFMAGTTNWLPYLKIRAGWGKSGNDQVGNYNGYTTFSTDPGQSYYGLDGALFTSTPGFQSSGFGNADAKWETTTSTNIGIDANLFNDALSLNFDVYQRKTSDMLYPLGIPAVLGVASVPSVNIGSMQNNGFELMLSHKGSLAAGELKYNVGVTFSHYKNEILQLSNNVNESILGSGGAATAWGGTNTIAQVGTSFPEFYGYIVDGIFQTQAEVDAHPKAFGNAGTYNEVGHFKFRDFNNDGVIDALDRTIIGSPHPDFTAGLNIDMEFKGFDLAAFFYSSYGNQILNETSRYLDFTVYNGNRSADRLYNSWGSPYVTNNADAFLPKADRNTSSYVNSTFFVEDGSYLRLKNLQLGYTLPESVTKKLKLSGIRIYVQGSNLFTFTKYRGLDPEIRYNWINWANESYGNNGTYLGIDQLAWPSYKQFLIGINIDI